MSGELFSAAFEPIESMSTERFQEVIHEILWDGPCGEDCPCLRYPFTTDNDGITITFRREGAADESA